MAALDLSLLSPDTLRLVRDTRYRARLTSDLLRSDPSSLESVQARDAIDAAVVEILAAAGLPRGPTNGPIVDRFNRGWFGRKVEDCRLLIDVETFASWPDEVQPDVLLKTWMHESLHARLPYSPGFSREWREAAGYEEGMVEGLAHLLVVDGLGLRSTVSTHRFYVTAYRSSRKCLGSTLSGCGEHCGDFPRGISNRSFSRWSDVYSGSRGSNNSGAHSLLDSLYSEPAILGLTECANRRTSRGIVKSCGTGHDQAAV